MFDSGFILVFFWIFFYKDKFVVIEDLGVIF